jgi:hypothetical protein
MNARLGMVGIGALILGFTTGCGDDNGGAGGGAGGGGQDGGTEASTDGGVPVPVGDNPPCVLSADCPPGMFCDLGECIQECNTDLACVDGEACSPRARCLEEGEEDQDPEPTTDHEGTISTEPTTLPLTDRDEQAKVVLKSTSDDPVRYRVQLNAPFLRLEEPRGEFVGSTTLTFGVDTSSLTERDVAGSIKIFTTLGETAIDTSMKVGITGTYQGSLRYEDDTLALGDARLALDLVEDKGDVKVRVDPSRSLLFPDTGGGTITGVGTYAHSEGVVVSLSQRIGEGFGDERNSFGRPLGRKLVLRMSPGSNGRLSGTFEETIHGLFVQPVQLSGTVSLSHRASVGDPSFSVGTPPTMPGTPNPGEILSPADVFGWATNSCESVVCPSVGPCDLMAAIPDIEQTYYQPLLDSMVHKSGTDAFQSLADSCELSVGYTSTQQYQTSSKRCGLGVPLACGLALASQEPTGNTSTARAFGRLMQETLAARLLVAKNDVVEGLNESLVNGASAELARYDHAIATLGPAARWVLQPSVLEYMRSMPPEGAKGDPPSDDETQNASYPSARALADLLRTMSVLDGERARVGAAASWSDAPVLAKEAQQRALLRFLEAAVLTEVLQEWGQAPAPVTATLTGVLGPLDQGFAAASEGANAFGVPDGFVPFVYRPEDVGKGATNFEQMLAIATAAREQHGSLEEAYKANERTFELNEQQLRAEIGAVKTLYDTQIKSLCGVSFEPDDVTGMDSWSDCAKDNQGQIGEMQIEIERAMAALRSAESRIAGMKDKIQIDQNALVRTQQVHSDTLRFIDQNGKSIEAIIMAETIITAEQKMLEVASNSQVLNFGAPVAMAAADSMLELMKGELEVQKQRLHSAQTMRFEQAGAEIELITGMANIQKQMIDLAQLGVDMQQDAIGVVLAQLRAKNSLDQARLLWQTRQEALALITSGLNPLNDPSYRVLRDQLGLDLLRSRARVQRQMFLAGHALSYEIDQPVPTMGGAVLGATNSLRLATLSSCMQQIFSDYRVAFGSPQPYTTEVSVREMLGIHGPRVDEVTGEEIDEGEQLRRILLRNQNLDGNGGVGISFSTNLQPDNGLWSTNVCTDRITAVRAQIVGDFLGDNDARVLLALEGGGVLRGCGSEDLHTWTFGADGSTSSTAVANIQAGVNSFGTASANGSLRGSPVASATWHVMLPGGSTEPANADLELMKIEDIVLEIAHEALPQKSSSIALDFSCLGGF